MAGAMAFFCLQGAPAGGDSPESETMKYQAVESVYGPGIRFFDWRVTSGDLATDHTFRQTRGVWRPGGEGVNAMFNAGGVMQIHTAHPATVTRSDYLFGGGGDVSVSVLFEVERMEEDGSFRIRFHDARTGIGGDGISATVSPAGLSIRLRDETVWEQPLGLVEGRFFRITLAMLAHSYRVDLDGETLHTGKMDYTRQDNEGWTHLDVDKAGIRVLEFEENLIVHDVAFPDWTRKELLYEEAFGKESLEKRWVVNGEPPVVTDEAFTFRPMSNVILDQRFDGPVAIDIEATPMPNDQFSAGLTDAIFIWMMDHPTEDLPTFMRNLPDAERAHYLPLPFYWMDFGGTNNVTTRFRRSPGLRMIRQFTDPPRLLERGRTYRVTLVQHGKIAEYWVDDEPWIRAWDPEPLTSGFIGHRSFNSELRVSDIKVWRIE